MNRGNLTDEMVAIQRKLNQNDMPSPGRALLSEVLGHLDSVLELLDEYHTTNGQGAAYRQPPGLNANSRRYLDVLIAVRDSNQTNHWPTVRDLPGEYRAMRRRVDRLLACGWLVDQGEPGRRALKLTSAGSLGIGQLAGSMSVESDPRGTQS
jgi:hypothetical protein